MADDRRKRRAAEFDRAVPGQARLEVTLGEDFDPSFKAGVRKKKEGVALLEDGVQLLGEGEERDPDREAVSQPLQGGAEDPVPATAGSAGSQLEVRGRGRQGARALGRLPEGVLGDALTHEYRMGAVVRHPRRPEVVRSDWRRSGDGPHADGGRSSVPDRDKEQRERLVEVKQVLEAQAPDGAHADPFEPNRARRCGRRARPERARGRAASRGHDAVSTRLPA